MPVTLSTPPVTKFAPVILPVAVNTAVPIFPILALPVTESDDSVPVLVMFGCAAVVNEPPNVVANTPAAPILPTFALPIALNVPPVAKLPPVIVPVAVTNPPVVKLPPDILPVAVIILVPILPILALPLTDNDVNVPVLVIFG